MERIRCHWFLATFEKYTHSISDQLNLRFEHCRREGDHPRFNLNMGRKKYPLVASGKVAEFCSHLG